MGEQHRPPSQRMRRGVTKEFKRDAVEPVCTGRPIGVVARELGIGDATLGTGGAGRIDRGEAEGLTTQERVRRGQLEAENTRLRWSVICANEPWPAGSRDLEAVSRDRCVDAQKAAGVR
jgi:transposase